MAKAPRNDRIVLMSLGAVAVMIGLTYASVPLYRLFCQATGFGGTVQRAETAPKQVLDQTVSVRFDANTSSKLDWTFHPVESAVKVKFGEQVMAHYEAVNLSDKTLTGSAVFNVSPPQAGAYFNKIQCFCFTDMTLQPGESLEAPVVFFIDPAIEKERDLKSATTITLSYTFFPAKGSPKPLAAAKDGTGSNL